jgi:hypothetical protein
MTKTFLTFATSMFRYSQALITKEATSLRFFDQVIRTGPDDLDPEFLQQHQTYMENTPLYGFYLFKPQIIWQHLQRMNEGDILVYADAGCKIYPEHKDRLSFFLDRVTHAPSGMVVQQGTQKEIAYTKQSVLQAYDFYCHPAYETIDQPPSGVIWIRKNAISCRLIDEWRGQALLRTPFVPPSPDEVQDDRFIAHRYDQSVLSQLCLRHQVDRVPNEIYPIGCSIISADRRRGRNGLHYMWLRLRARMVQGIWVLGGKKQ